MQINTTFLRFLILLYRVSTYPPQRIRFPSLLNHVSTNPIPRLNVPRKQLKKICLNKCLHVSCLLEMITFYGPVKKGMYTIILKIIFHVTQLKNNINKIILKFPSQTSSLPPIRFVRSRCTRSNDPVQMLLNLTLLHPSTVHNSLTH